MTMWEKIKAWFNDAIMLWKMDIVRAIALGCGCATAAYFSWQHLQFLEYCLAAVIFGYGIIHAVVLFFKNPVKEEMKIQKWVRVRDALEESFKDEAVITGNVVLHFKHLIEKHLGHPVVITAAPTVAPAQEEKPNAQ